MKVGDVIINPYVNEYFEGKPNPMYKTMILSVGKKYTKALTHRCEKVSWYTSDVEKWKISHHIDIKAIKNIIKDMILEEK